MFVRTYYSWQSIGQSRFIKEKYCSILIFIKPIIAFDNAVSFFNFTSHSLFLAALSLPLEASTNPFKVPSDTEIFQLRDLEKQRKKDV